MSLATSAVVRSVLHSSWWGTQTYIIWLNCVLHYMLLSARPPMTPLHVCLITVSNPLFSMDSQPSPPLTHTHSSAFRSHNSWKILVVNHFVGGCPPPLVTPNAGCYIEGPVEHSWFLTYCIWSEDNSLIWSGSHRLPDHIGPQLVEMSFKLLFFLRSHRVRMPVGAPALSRQHKYCVKRAVFGVNITCGLSIVAYMNVCVTQVNVRSFWNHLLTPVTSSVCQLSAHRTTSPSGLPDYFYYSCMDCLWSIVHYLL